MNQLDEMRQRMNAAMLKTQDKEQKKRGLGKYPAYSMRKTPELVFNCVEFSRLSEGRNSELMAAGFAKSSLQDWRSGSTMPSRPILRRLAKALGVPVSALTAPIIEVYEW